MREEERDFSLRLVKVCLGYSQVSVNSVEGAGDQITFPVPGDVGTTPYCWTAAKPPRTGCASP